MHTQGCTLCPSVSSSTLVSHPEFFWAYRCIYLMFTWVDLRGPHYDRGPCQKNVYNLEYLDWFKMHFSIWSKLFIKLDLEKLSLLFVYPYQFNSTKIYLGGMDDRTFLHWVTWLMCNIQTKTQFLSHFLKDRIYRGIWFSPEYMASKLCLVVQSFISVL